MLTDPYLSVDTGPPFARGQVAEESLLWDEAERRVDDGRISLCMKGYS